ncbi:hypothetical protein ACRAWD_28870 [Caulobacter segnis]
MSKPVDLDQLISVLRVSVQRADARKLVGRSIVNLSAVAQPVSIDHVDARRPVPAQSPRAVRPTAGPSVPIVDDDERNAFAATQALEALGQELVVAPLLRPEALRKLPTDDLRGHPAGPASCPALGRLRDRRPDPRAAAHPRRADRVPDRRVPRRGPHLQGLFGRRRRRGVQARRPVHPRARVQVLVDLHIKRLELARRAGDPPAPAGGARPRLRPRSWRPSGPLQASCCRQQAIQRALPIVFYSRMADAPYAALSVSECQRQWG